MKLYLNGNDERYAAEQIMMMLFPNDKPECVIKRPENEDFAEIRIRENGYHVYARTDIVKEGKSYSGASVLPIRDCKDNELEHKRRIRQVLKVSFYKAAVQTLEKLPEWGAMTGIRPAKVAAKLMMSGKKASETERILQETYFVQPRRCELTMRAAMQGMRVLEENRPRDVSLYIGIPFCASRCKYCSFVSHSIDKAGHLIEPYLATLHEEMAIIGNVVHERNLHIKSIYIGGGTPTALCSDDLRMVMKGVCENFDISGVLEYTVEAGRPDTVDMEKLQIIREFGATRISANPQSMDNRVLQLMGRNHTAEDIVRMVEDIHTLGGLDINMDVIAGLPGDSESGFRDTIERVLKLSPDNVTVHTLAIKKGSTLRDEKMVMPSADEVERMVDTAYDAVTKEGLLPYYLYRQKYMSGNLENVGYARPGKESLYNILIMEELHTILSLGAGGVTKLVSREDAEIIRIFNPKYPYEYNNAQEKFCESARKIKDFYSRMR